MRLWSGFPLCLVAPASMLMLTACQTSAADQNLHVGNVFPGLTKQPGRFVFDDSVCRRDQQKTSDSRRFTSYEQCMVRWGNRVRRSDGTFITRETNPEFIQRPEAERLSPDLLPGPAPTVAASPPPSPGPNPSPMTPSDEVETLPKPQPPPEQRKKIDFKFDL